jgi:hypothetical protein
MKTPTAATGELFILYVQTLMPFEIVVISMARSYLRGSGISPGGRSPKFKRVGALLN